MKTLEVILRIDRGALLTIEEFPEIDYSSKEYLLKEREMDLLFGIIGTAKYKSYDDSIKQPLVTNNYRPAPLADLYDQDYSADYKEKLKDIFCYTIYPEGEQCILSLKFDYIKHHTAVAFPTPILLKNKPSVIAYEITSKNSPDVVKGSLTVVSEDDRNNI